MIVSYIPGRVRLRAAALQDPATARKILDMLEGFEGIESATSNLETGSLLVLYDPGVISEEMLMQAAVAFEEEFGGEAPRARSGGPRSAFALPFFLARRLELNALLGSLGLTVASAFVGRRAHIAAGVLLCLLSAKHVYDRRNQMF